MAVSHLSDACDITCITLQALPPCRLNDNADTSLQIAAHLRRTFEKFGTGRPASLRVPSAMDLSFFYNRSILDVLDGLFALKNQHYEYVMNGLDAEIILHDPMGMIGRSKTHHHLIPAAWGALSDDLPNPWSFVKWSLVKRHISNPIMDTLPRKAV